MFLTTKRLCLRNLREEDAEAVYTWRNDRRCYRFQRWKDTSREAVLGLIRASGEDVFLSKKEEQHYILCAGDIPVGELAYFYTEKDRCVTLGITIAPDCQRRGYGYEILSAVTMAVREAYPELDIVALIDRENAPSIALFEKLGFLRECYAESIASYVYVIYAANEGEERPS